LDQLLGAGVVETAFFLQPSNGGGDDGKIAPSFDWNDGGEAVADFLAQVA